jgi:lipopolysaccharide export system protein LptA
VAALLLVCVSLAGVYFYARRRVENALKQVPGKIGIEIQQSAQGFTLSSSQQGRTIFKLQASKAVQFKQGGRAELHDVSITLYGRDSSRFDQVYGSDFEYDQQSGDVKSKGEVSIDLESNPQGILNPDQAPPKELKNPIHLRTTDLILNQKTGNGWTPAAVEFSVPQANGSALGAEYIAKTGTLKLLSQVRIRWNGATSATLLAREAMLEKSPREIVLRDGRADAVERHAQADEIRLFLRDDNALDHALAVGHVRIHSLANPAVTVSAEQLEVNMRMRGVERAVFSGEVNLRTEGPESAEASAARAVLGFDDEDRVNKISSDGGVKLTEHPRPGVSTAQQTEVSSPGMEFFLTHGRRLSRAETVGPPEITLSPATPKSGPRTQVTADKFTASFSALGQLSLVHGESHARVVTTTDGKNGPAAPQAVSTSDTIDAYFRPGSGVESLLEQGHFAYSSGTEQAFADRARYTSSDQVAVLSGSPRIVQLAMTTSAQTVRLNRQTGEGVGEGDVKTTYTDWKPQAGGALLAGSSPVHVTARMVRVDRDSGVALYTGNVRLWQDANLVEAPSIRFEKDRRTLVADSSPEQKVSTMLAEIDRRGNSSPVRVTSSRLVYRDEERQAHFEGGVLVQGADLTISADNMNVFLLPREKKPEAQVGDGPAQLDRIVATGSVRITQSSRRAVGEQLTYTAADEKFVLTGGLPSIFDAEHGKITGVSLTYFRRDDRVVVEGDSRFPAVTHTRVVR